MFISQTRQKLDKDYDDLENDIHIGIGTIIEPHAIIYPNVTIGNNCVVATCAVIKQHTKIGEHSIFGTLSNSDGNVKIGNWTTVQGQCLLGYGTRIGNNCFIGPCFMSINTKAIGDKNSKFGYPNTTDMPRYQPIVKDNVKIGARVSLMPGVTIGKYAIIDAGSFITKSISEGAHVRSVGITASKI
ncbi:MAG: Transferase [Cenarchaeum symbiont of Oopsacas minuta]|nr:Transferase [Cenarchaeum symbiont of Oopsacas minuta]